VEIVSDPIHSHHSFEEHRMSAVKSFLFSSALGAILLLPAGSASALILDVAVNGSDAIFLAGRTDVIIPSASAPWTTGTHLIRHSGPTPEEIKETLPPGFSITAGDVIRALDPAVGGVSFFNGFGAPLFGPGGNGVSGSNLVSLDGISGYFGPQGPLVGVFLDDSIPSSGLAPATLDFSDTGLGINFLSLSPELRQIFYIGDGITSGGDFQQFIAPTLENVKTKKYPISRDLYVITNGKPTGLTGDFIKYILSPDGQKIVVDEGYVPVI